MKRMAISLAATLASVVPVAAESGREIVRSSRIRGGLIVHIGCDDGKLTRELLASDSFIWHGLDADAMKISAAHRHIGSENVYGRVSFQTLTGTDLPYADNLANLIVADDLFGITMD